MHIIFTFNELAAVGAKPTLIPSPVQHLALAWPRWQVHLMLQVFCGQVWCIRPPGVVQLEIQFQFFASPALHFKFSIACLHQHHRVCVKTLASFIFQF